MPVKIHGKEYITVNERVQEFHSKYENGSIQSELIEFTDRFIIKATATPDHEQPERVFTGYAYEMVGSSQINKTSALENCETSAIGRCLSFLGLGIIDSIASAEEVKNAIHQQDTHGVTEEQKEKYQELRSHAAFKGKLKDTDAWWVKIYDEPNPNAAAAKALLMMKGAIKLFNSESMKEKN